MPRGHEEKKCGSYGLSARTWVVSVRERVKLKIQSKILIYDQFPQANLSLNSTSLRSIILILIESQIYTIFIYIRIVIWKRQFWHSSTTYLRHQPLAATPSITQQSTRPNIIHFSDLFISYLPSITRWLIFSRSDSFEYRTEKCRTTLARPWTTNF